MTASGFTTEGTFTPDNLIAGEFPRVERKVTIPAGQGACVRGQALKADGTKAAAVADCDSILAMDVDATAEAEAIAYQAGEFNSAAIIGFTVDAAAIAVLRAKNIYIQTNVGA